MLSALDLPEIRSAIAFHLAQSPQTLLSCMLVSKTWHDSFYPFRWQTVHLHGVHSVKDNVTLRRHAHHVRNLAFLKIDSLRHFSDLDRYSRVRRVRVSGAGGEGRVVWEKLAGLVGGAQGLRWLVVEDSVPLPVFLIALAGSGGGQGKGKEYRLGLSEEHQQRLQQQQEEEEEQEQEGESDSEDEGEDECGQGVEGRSGTGSLTTPTTSTTSVNTTIDSVTTATPLSFFSFTTAKIRSGGERRLDTLVWKRIRVPAANMDHLWRASRGATDLEFECLTITGIQGDSITTNTLPTVPTLVLTEHGATYPLRPLVTNPPLPSSQVQSLRVSWTIGLPVEWQLDLWIRPCRELRSLVWEAPSFPDPLLLQFARCIEDGTWSWLTSLEISACVAPFPSDAAIARILSASSSSSSSFYECSSYPPSPPRSTSSSSSSSSSYSFDSRRSSSESTRETRRPHQHHYQNVHRWERLIFRTIGFGPLAFEALRRHFGTLKTVKWIGYAGSVTNNMAREVLEGCPQLEEFHAPFLWVSDFVGSQSQIGQELKGMDMEKEKDGGMDQAQGSHSYFSTEITGPLLSPPLSPTPAPAFLHDQQQQQQLKPWPCEGLKSLFISATSPNFFSPPLSKPEEAVIRSRLATLKDLTYYCVGSAVFSTTFRHEY